MFLDLKLEGNGMEQLCSKRSRGGCPGTAQHCLGAGVAALKPEGMLWHCCSLNFLLAGQMQW